MDKLYSYRYLCI